MLCILSKHFRDKYLLHSLIQQMFIEVLLCTKHCSTDPPGIEQGTQWENTHTHTNLPSQWLIWIYAYYFGHLMWRSNSLEKTLMLRKIEDRRKRGMIEDEMVGWHHQLSEHEFKQTPGDGEGQGSLGCFSSWDWRVRHDLATEQQFVA